MKRTKALFVTLLLLAMIVIAGAGCVLIDEALPHYVLK
jgi:hypothetical protein